MRFIQSFTSAEREMVCLVYLPYLDIVWNSIPNTVLRYSGVQLWYVEAHVRIYATYD